MEILEYRPALLSELTALYNCATEPVPHCYPVVEADFGAALAGDDESPAPAARQAWTARRDGRLVGFVDALAEPPSDDERRAPRPVIRFLWHERQDRQAGQALLETAQAFLGEHLPGPVYAFPQRGLYWFHAFHNAFLSDHLDQVVALLLLNGYRKAGGEVFMDWLDYPAREPVAVDLDFEVRIEAEPAERGDRPAIVARAYTPDGPVGTCLCRHGGECSRDPRAAEFAFVDWLGVREPYQGIGLGKHLLQCGLNEARRVGYRHASISTAWDNHRAFVLYTHFGFRMVDWTYGYRQEADG